MSDVVKRLPNVEGVTAEPWDVAFKTHQYRQAIQTARRQSASVIQDKLLNYYRTEGYIDEFRPYRTARGRFLIGKFQVKREERGLDALEGWQRLIYDDDQILSLASDFELQRLHGIRRDGQSKKEFDNEVAAIQGKMRLIRADAKFFLAQCLFDNANENAAGSWLEDLKTGAQGADRWLEGVSYLLGRSYESRGDYDRAIEMLSDESLVQSHGNLIRTRLLKQQIKNVYGDVSTKAEPKEEAKEDDQPEKAEGDKKDKAAATKKAEKETAPEKEAGGQESATSEAAEPVEEKPAEEKSEGEKSGKEG